MSENLFIEKTGKKQGKVGKGHPPVETRFKPGQSGNPKGRPKGSRNWRTCFYEVCKLVGEDLKLGKDPDRVMVEIIKRGIIEALKGKYPFWKEIIDRCYGKAPEKVEMDTKIEEIKKIEDLVQKMIIEEEKEKTN